MENTLPKVLVKVGKSSRTRFNNVDAFRAVTFKEAQRLLLSNPDIASIVVEGVYSSELDTAVKVVTIAKSEGKHIFIHGDTNDYALDELNNRVDGLIRVNSLKELHDELTNITGVNVSTSQINTFDDYENNEYSDIDNIDIDNSGIDINDNDIYDLNEIDIPNDIIESSIEHPNIETKEDLMGIDDLNIDGIEISTEDVLSEHKEKTVIEMSNLIADLTREKAELAEQLGQALDRIELLLGIKEALEDERDMYKETLDNLDSDTNIIEDPVDQAELQKIQDELQQYKDKYDKANIEIASLREEIDAARQQIVQYKEDIDELNNQIDAYKEEINRLNCDIDSHKDEIDKLKLSIYDANDRVATEVKVRLKLVDVLTSTIEDSGTIYNDIDEKNIEIEKYKAEIKNLESSLDSVKITLQQVQKNYDYLVEYQAKCNNPRDEEIKRLTEELEDTRLRCDKVNNEIILKSTEIRTLSTQLKNVTEESLRNESNYKKVLEANSALEEANKALMQSTSFLKSEVEKLHKQLDVSNNSVRNLEETNRQLKASVTNMSKGVIVGDKKLRINCNYTGRGFIIPVFGSGSYGVTTTAMSIAKKLANDSVLYIDFDIANPKADSWFGKVPIIKDLTGINDALKKTGVGALIEKGTDYVIDNEKLIMQRVVETKTGYIDYFSGAYTRIDITKLMSVNFTQFINYVGNTYKYVVVDLGRFGSSEVGDAIIAMFNSIAYKSIIVTLNNKYDVRTLGVKVHEDKLNLSNTIWMLNIADSSKVDPLINKSVGEAKLIIMPKVMQMYGSEQTFDKVSATRDRLSELIEIITG